MPKRFLLDVSQTVQRTRSTHDDYDYHYYKAEQTDIGIATEGQCLHEKCKYLFDQTLYGR